MKPRTSIAKGKLLEDWVVERLRRSGLDTQAYRQKGSGSGLNKGDVWNALDIHFECKNVKQMEWGNTFKQMTRDNISGFPEVLVWHLPNTPLEATRVVIPWDYLEELLLGSKEEKQIDNPLNAPDMRFRISRIKDDLRWLVKQLGGDN